MSAVAWVGLALGVVNLVVWGAVVVAARRLWSKLSVTYGPMLSAFMAPPTDDERERMTSMFGPLGGG